MDISIQEIQNSGTIYAFFQHYQPCHSFFL